MRFGFTGHQNVPPKALLKMVGAIETLIGHEDVVLITSLAEGADQAVAEAILDQGGSIEVVIPCDRYETTFTTKEPLASFQMLKARAERVSLLPFPDPSEAAFMAAGLVVVERCDQVLAMWDGQPSRGLGGTADVIQYAHQEGRRVVNLWPSGLTRT